MKLAKIDRVIELSKEKTRLLEELKQATHREACTHELLFLGGRDRILYKLPEGSLVYSGKAANMAKYLRKSKILPEDIHQTTA